MYNPSLNVVNLTPANSSHPSYYSLQTLAFQMGAYQYGDPSPNNYTFSTVSNSKYLGSTFIQTAQADASSTTFSMSVSVNTLADIYLLLDSNASVPAWVAQDGFVYTGDHATNSHGHTFNIYEAPWLTGTLHLGASYTGSGTIGDMYSVLIQPTLNQDQQPAPLRAYWNFNEDTGTIVNDSATATVAALQNEVTLMSASLNGFPDNYFVGATIHTGEGNNNLIETGTVLSSMSGSVTFTTCPGNYPGFGWGSGEQFFFTGQLDFLDAPGEWFRNQATGEPLPLYAHRRQSRQPRGRGKGSTLRLRPQQRLLHHDRGHPLLRLLDQLEPEFIA